MVNYEYAWLCLQNKETLKAHLERHRDKIGMVSFSVYEVRVIYNSSFVTDDLRDSSDKITPIHKFMIISNDEIKIACLG